MTPRLFRVPVVPLLVAVAFVFVLERAARADPVASGQAPRRVRLVVAADARESQELGQVVTELLGRLAVEVRVDRVERLDFGEIARPASLTPEGPPGENKGPPRQAERYFARAFVDLRDPGRAVLWFVDARHDRILVRQLDRKPGGEELLREELGHILETSTEGLLAGAEIGLPRAEVIPTLPEPVPPVPPSPPSEASNRNFQVAALYEVEAFASPARVVHGPEASVYFRFTREVPSFGVWLTGQYRLPVHVEGTSVGARIEGGALRALLTLDLPSQRRVTWRFALGAGSDLLTLAPETVRTSGVALAGSELLAFAVVKAAVGVELRASSLLCFWGRIAVDIDPSDARYVFERAGGEETVLRPWPVRPGFAAGVGFP